MSPCKQIYNHKKSSQISPKECKSILTTTTHVYNIYRGTPSCTFAKGSYTLEAAIIFPMVAAFFVSILFFFRVLQVETEVQAALAYSGRMTAVEAASVENSNLLFISAEGLFRSKLSENKYAKQYVIGGNLGISLSDSDLKGDNIRLIARYTMKLPIDFFSIKGITLTQSTSNRKWTGKSIEKNDTDVYVYYTDEGTVYHLTTACTFLDLSIKGVKIAEIAAKRNNNGAKYSECSYCVAKNTTNQVYFITNYGTKYHSTCGCKNLKRTIHMVKKSEIGGMPLCSKCGAA